MIQLRSDCLVFETPAGGAILCSAEQIAYELMGESLALLDPDLIDHATAAVFHYFKFDLNRQSVSVVEFSQALVKVLRCLGVKAKVIGPPSPVRVAEADLRLLACESGKGFELAFFQRLREELVRKLEDDPHVVRFKGLRGCVKQLVGARRWSDRCQQLSDQIVEYLRHYWSERSAAPPSSLVVT